MHREEAWEWPWDWFHICKLLYLCENDEPAAVVAHDDAHALACRAKLQNVQHLVHHIPGAGRLPEKTCPLVHGPGTCPWMNITAALNRVYIDQ
eukprot:1148316-Pelagomonas_calceolata.AAC.5